MDESQKKSENYRRKELDAPSNKAAKVMRALGKVRPQTIAIQKNHLHLFIPINVIGSSSKSACAKQVVLQLKY